MLIYDLLSKAQQDKLTNWLEKLSFQKVGAIGGAYTYSFTPTGLGTIITVTYLKGHPNEQTIDLTEYENW